MKANRSKSQKGTSVIEFALSWAVLWIVLSGLFQFGYAFYTYNVLLTSVTNATELGSKMTFDAATPETFKTAIKNMVIYGDTATGSRPLVPNLTASNVSVTLTPDAIGPQFITVSVTYQIDAVIGKFQLTNKPRVTTPFIGQTICTGC